MFGLACPVPAIGYRHLIHKQDGERHDEVSREMYVKLDIYDLTQKKSVELRRGTWFGIIIQGLTDYIGIRIDGAMEYSINDEETSKEDYKKFIHEQLSIPVTAIDNLFIKQGSLESTAYIKGGSELTSLLEKVSGSYEYK